MVYYHLRKDAMLIPRPLELGIPFDSWRPEQEEILSRCLESDKKFIIIDMPTGGGKSGVAVGLHYLTGSTGTIVTTSTIFLQEQYQEQFGMPTMKGRSNFACDLKPDLSARDGLCQLGKGCGPKEKWVACEYYRAKALAVTSPLVVLNSSYYLHEVNFVGGFRNRSLLILDEGHLIEGALMGFIGKKIQFRSISKYTDRWREDVNSTKKLRSILEEIEPSVEKDLQTSFDIASSTESPDDMKSVRRSSALLESIRFILSPSCDAWILDREKDAFALSPIMVGKMADQYLFKHANRVVLMSATILNGEIFGRQLGIEPEEMDFFAVPSPFPKMQRPVIIKPVVKLSHKSTDEDYQEMASEVDRILSHHKEDHGIIHTVSFKLRDKLMDLLSTGSRNRIITHGGKWGGDRTEAIMELKNSLDPVVLMSPSAETGLDLRDNEGRFCIWAKIPFGDLASTQTMIRKILDPEWYMWMVAASIVQGCGRIVRHDKDWGISYILDKNITWIMKQHKSLFPQWFLDAIVVHKK